MASPTVTINDLVGQVRSRCNLVSGSNVATDAEILTFINGSGAEFADIIVSTYEDYFTTRLEFDLTGSSTVCAYTPDTNVLKVRGIDRQFGPGWAPLDNMPFNERGLYQYQNQNIIDRFNFPLPSWEFMGPYIYFYPPGQAGGHYRLTYVPGWNNLVSGSNVTISGVYTQQNWYEYIVIDAALKTMVKKNDPDRAGQLAQAKQQMEFRIKSRARNRNASGLRRIEDASGVFDQTRNRRFLF